MYKQQAWKRGPMINRKVTKRTKKRNGTKNEGEHRDKQTENGIRHCNSPRFKQVFLWLAGRQPSIQHVPCKSNHVFHHVDLQEPGLYINSLMHARAIRLNIAPTHGKAELIAPMRWSSST